MQIRIAQVVRRAAFSSSSQQRFPFISRCQG
jgi:hypothetical protein